jgi:hypothetical protein
MLLLVQASVIFSQEVVIKSLKTFTTKDVNSIPVLSSPRDLLTIDFDVQAEYPPNIHIIFEFCDRNWKLPIISFLQIRDKTPPILLLFFTSTTVEDAKYHYTNTFR